MALSATVLWTAMVVHIMRRHCAGLDGYDINYEFGPRKPLGFVTSSLSTAGEVGQSNERAAQPCGRDIVLVIANVLLAHA